MKLENNATLRAINFYRLMFGGAPRTTGKWLACSRAENLLGLHMWKQILALQTCGSHFNASFWRTNALPLGFLPAQQMHHYANTDSTKAGVLWLDIASKEATRTSICNFHLQPGDKNKETKLSLWTFLCGVVAGKQLSSKYVTSLTACPFTLRSWPVLQRLLSLELGTFLIIKWALFPIGSQRWVAGHQFKRRKIIDSIKLA